ncbi:hypothetical protein H920_17600 [Fukomys damarensis]|uniref:Uncharacterized protein n=1 Tax=Fukomys damarensis TaxID=885580 RepID=A0A091CRW3_FUKDA|nr:hypothetical protein H920_17600 [Fukomys damarensis]
MATRVKAEGQGGGGDIEVSLCGVRKDCFGSERLFLTVIGPPPAVWRGDLCMGLSREVTDRQPQSDEGARALTNAYAQTTALSLFFEVTSGIDCALLLELCAPHGTYSKARVVSVSQNESVSGPARLL